MAISLTKSLKKVNKPMVKNNLSGKKNFNEKTPEFKKALEKA